MSSNFFRCILLPSSYRKLPRSLVFVIIFFVGAGKTIFMSILDGLDPFFFCRKMRKTRYKREEKDGRLFLFPAKIGISSFIDNMIKVLFPIFNLIWRVSTYVFRQENVQIGERNFILLLYIL